MFVSPISSLNRSNYSITKSKKTQKPQEPQEVPSFKSNFDVKLARANYHYAFKRIFQTPTEQYVLPNKKVYEDLMTYALKGFSEGELTEVAKEYFDHSYDYVMNAFRTGYPVYNKIWDTLSEQSYLEPMWLLRNGSSFIASIVNFGRQGGLFNILFGKSTQDTRICFHGTDGLENCVICLGRDNDGIDSRVTTDEGIGIIVRAGIKGIL